MTIKEIISRLPVGMDDSRTICFMDWPYKTDFIDKDKKIIHITNTIILNNDDKDWRGEALINIIIDVNEPEELEIDIPSQYNTELDKYIEIRDDIKYRLLKIARTYLRSMFMEFKHE